jgi:integrase
MNRKYIQDQIDKATPSGKSRILIRIEKADFLLQVTPAGVKSWVYRYTIRGKTRVIGMGAAGRISFQEAQKRSRKIRVLLDDGIDPLAEKDRIKAEQKQTAAQSMIFQQCAEEFIRTHREAWRSQKHAAQWVTTLQTYVYPIFGKKPVSTIHIEDVQNVIKPLWDSKKIETADRVRGRIEKILGWATVKGYRSGENPARWTGYLSEVFPKRNAIRKIKHHAALPYDELPDFYKVLELTEGIGAILMRFVILTWARTTEARAAQWEEIDFDGAIWTLPPERMKSNRLHRVALSEPALEILRFLRQFNEAQTVPSRYVFNGQKYGVYPSEAVMLSLLKRLGRRDLTPHGFRSCGRDYMAHETSFPREIQEVALAHVLQDKTEAAYQRGDYLKKRREMMEHWGRYCISGKSSEKK